MALTQAEQAELAALDSELGGGLSTSEQAELDSLDSELGVDDGALPSPTGELVASPSAALTADFSDPISNISRIAGEAISTGADVFGSNIAGLIGGTGQAIGIESELGTPQSRAVGEAAIQSIPFSLAGTAAIIGLAKTKLPQLLSAQPGKIRRAIGESLSEIASNPAKVLAFETTIGATAAGVGETTEQATGSGGLGLAAEFATGVAAPGILAKRLFSRDPSIRYSVLDDSIDTELANILRNNPEALARAEASIGDFAELRLGTRLDLASKDPTFIALTEKLAATGGQALNDVINQSAREMRGVIKNVINGITDGSMTPDDAIRLVDDRVKAANDARDTLIASLPEGDDIKTLSNNLFNEQIGRIHGFVMDEIAKNYDNLSLNVKLPNDRVRAGITEALTAAKASGFGAKAVNKKSGITQYSDILEDDLARLELPTAEGGIDDVTADSINLIRSQVLSDIRARGRLGQSTGALIDLEKGLTKTLESFPELEVANSLYRSFKNTFGKNRIGKFFGNKQQTVKSPEQFIETFLARDAIKGKEEIDNFVSAFGAANGFTAEDAVDMARSGYLAMLRSGGDQISPSRWKLFMRNNKAGLKAYGLTDEFSDFSTVVQKASDHAASVSRSAVDRSALARFGFNANPGVLRNAILNNRKALMQEVAALPKESQESARKAIMRSLVFDKDGIIEAPDVISRNLLKNTGTLGLNRQQASKIATLMQLLSRDASGGVKGIVDVGSDLAPFSAAFSDIPVFEKIKSALLERITRPLLKGIRSARVVSQFRSQTSIRSALQEALFTGDGAARIVQLAKKSEQSRLLIRSILYGRAGLQTFAEAEE